MNNINEFRDITRPLLNRVINESVREKGMALESLCIVLIGSSAKDLILARAFDFSTVKDKEELRALLPDALIPDLMTYMKSTTKGDRNICVLYLFDNDWHLGSALVAKSTHAEMMSESVQNSKTIDFTYNRELPSREVLTWAAATYDLICTYVRDHLLLRGLDVRDHCMVIDNRDCSRIGILAEHHFGEFTKYHPDTTNYEREFLATFMSLPKTTDTVRALFMDDLGGSFFGLISLPTSLIVTSQGGSS